MNLSFDNDRFICVSFHLVI